MTALDPITPPRTLRQSLLARADVCRRSAYLALKYPDQDAHELAFGSAAHAFLERLVSDLIEQGESSLYAPAEGEDPVAAAKQVASMSAAMVDEILVEHREWPVPIAHASHSVDHLRQVAYHLAVGLDIVEPRDTVLGIEQGFELDLECGWTLTGRVDLLTQLRPDTLGVDDLKSTFNVEAESAFADLFQMKTYPLLVMFGVPVERVVCVQCDGAKREVGTEYPRLRPCDHCEGRGYITNRLPSVGDGIGYIRARHLYGRFLDDDGTVRTRETIFTRQDIQNWRHDVERLAADFVERLGSTDPEDWPAIDGSHCNQCACRAECPLPQSLKRYAGRANTREDAAGLLAAATRMRDDAGAAVKEARELAKRVGAIRVGDFEWDWRDTEKWETDWAALEEAVFEAVTFGKPFELGLYRRRKTGTSFAKRKLAPEEIAAQIEEEAADAGDRFGEAPPF